MLVVVGDDVKVGVLLVCFCFWSDVIRNGTFVCILARAGVEDCVDR